MEVMRDLGSCPTPPGGCVVTMGNYDGVHRGHREVIEALNERVIAGGGASALITYEPHTLAVINPARAPKLLTTTARKLELLAETGLDYTLVLTFDETRRSQSAEDFVAEVIGGCLHARQVVVGADVRFGFRAGGDIGLLESLGPQHGFSAHMLDLVVTDGQEKISSTRIRQALQRGDVAWASWALERPHEVGGQVVGGDKRGATIGYPTANVGAPPWMCLPGDGIYAGWARLGERRIPTVVSVGKRPTFYEHADASLVEAHLFDFSDDIYGEELVVEFHHWIRPELRFDGVSDLVEQIDRDAAEARALLDL